MSYATLAEFHSFSNLISVTDDVSIQKLLDAADRMIDRFTNRPDGYVALAAATSRLYTAKGGPFLLVDEFVDATLVEVKDSPSDTSYVAWATPTALLAGDWIAFRGDPSSPEFNRTPFCGIMVDPGGDYSTFTDGTYGTLRGFRPSSNVSRGVPTVRVWARWGYAVTVPADIKVAACMIAERTYKRMQGNMAVSLATADLGVIEMFSKMDPDVQQILVAGRYMRPSILR
jgi:hypothetical protein